MMQWFIAYLALVVLAALQQQHASGNTVFTGEELLKLGQQAKDSFVEAISDASNKPKDKLERFGASASRLALYEKSAMGAKYFTEGFGSKLGKMLSRVVENHPDPASFLSSSHGDREIEHHMVPMRDGKKLSTLVIFPVEMKRGKETRGAMLSRSPYAPTSDQIADLFTVMNGFVAIVQDQRGTFLSEGEFSMWTHDAEDGQDTLAWIRAQPWSNGKVFGAGISADGCGLATMFRLNPPAELDGALYMWASANGHETTFQGGAFRSGLITGWMTLQAPLTKGVSLKKTLPELLANWKLVPGGYWEPIQGVGKFAGVHWPTVHITGWWDIFQQHQLQMYNGFRADASTFEHRIVVGPIGHCVLGMPPNADVLMDEVEARVMEVGYGFASELFGGFETRGHIFRDMLDLINIYVQGSRWLGEKGEPKVGHFWSSFPAWPKVEPTKLYFAGNKQLRYGAWGALRDGDAGFAEYTYNPTHPWVTHGGNNLVLHLLGFGCGSLDQRHVERHTEHLVTFDLVEPVEQPLALTGEVKVVLYVSTSAADTDFHVSLNDVHPGNEYSMQIRYGLQRLKLRDSTGLETKVSEVVPDKVYKMEFSLWHTSYIVAPGHSLRVTVSSSNTPYFAVNPNTGDDSDQYGVKSSVTATNRVYFSKEHPSHVVVPVVDIKDLPKNDKL